MKKSFKLVNLDCAHCASKMEEKIKNIKGVNEASVSFLTQKLTVDINDEIFDNVLEEIMKVSKKAVPSCKIVK